MKFSFRIIGITLIAGLGFLSGRFYDELTNFWRKPVIIYITNESEQPLKSIVISYHGYKTKGTIKVEPETSEKVITILFYQAGEGGFTMDVELENGQLLKNNEGYIEGGYSFNKVVTATEIKNK